jgi:hypothetical protein
MGRIGGNKDLESNTAAAVREITNMVTMLTNMFTTLQPSADALDVSSNRFGTTMHGALSKIVMFWEIGGQTVNMNTMMGAFVAAMQGSMAKAQAALDGFVVYLGGAFVTALKAVNMEGAGKAIGTRLNAGIGIGIAPYTILELIQSLGRALGGEDWFQYGYNTGKSWNDGFRAGAAYRSLIPNLPGLKQPDASTLGKYGH